ncbi:class II fructose-bisphosphate aldolase [Nocardia sp. CWNU-33]|uniref:class II fructose-bisphosphate aldolase n=1 Tax=Nocardia sp. CWNU-33 TaxID=3392117 RepID=UPI00398E3433
MEIEMRARLPDLAREQRRRRAALPAFTCYDLTTAIGVVTAAEAARCPVVLLVSSTSAAGGGGLSLIRALRSLADHAASPVCVQLDHATDPDLITAAVEAGADSVLADGSRMTDDANADFVAQTKARLLIDHPHTAVEAELGRIDGNEDVADAARATAGASLTAPDRVAPFLNRSGADLLAVSVGNVHGSYSGPPQLDLHLMAAIRATTDTPLVLHGASGLPTADLHRAVISGACKVNINTELRRTVFDTLDGALVDNRDGGLDLYSLLDRWQTSIRQHALSLIGGLIRSEIHP